MKYDRVVIGQTFVGKFYEEGGIEFEEGNIQMGLHIENFSSLLGIVGLGSATSWTVSNLLYQGGFTDWHGKGKKGLDFAVKIDRMTADKSGNVNQTQSVVIYIDISLPPNGNGDGPGPPDPGIFILIGISVAGGAVLTIAISAIIIRRRK